MSLGMLGTAAGLAKGFMGTPETPEQKQQRAIRDMIMGMAKGRQKAADQYDPMVAINQAMKQAIAAQGKMFASAGAEFNRNFKNKGGSPSGDTWMPANMQLAANDSQNPLGTWTADQNMKAFDMKQNAYALPASMLSQAGNANMQAASLTPQQNYGAMAQAGGSLLDKLMGSINKRKGSNTVSNFDPTQIKF